MIGFWRRRSKTFVVHLVFWPIIAVFVIWGFERLGNPVGAAAAVVNNHTISMVEYRMALQRMMDFYAQLMQGRFDDSMQKQYRIRQTALQQLINNELIAEQAEDIGVTVTDEEVRQKILEFPILQKEGRFSRENYDAMLRYYHQSAAQFEGELKKNGLIEKTRILFEANVIPSPAELEKEKLLKESKINIEFLKIDKDEVLEAVNVSDAAVDEFLKDDAHQKQVKENYTLQKALYTQEEQIEARHILIKATKGNKDQEKSALEKITKIKEEAQTQPFADLAKKYSDDSGTKVKGGDLGWFGKGRMVPEFEKAAFETAPGHIAGPIQTPFGFHLIQVEDKKAAGVTPFEQVQKSIAKKLIVQKKTDALLSDVQKKLSSSPSEGLKTFESLDPKAKWQETGPFTFADDQIPKIGENEEIMSAAFSLTPEKPFASKIFQVAGAYYALKLKKNEGADSKTVDVNKVESQPGHELGRSTFYSWAGKLFDKAKIKTNPNLMSEEPVGDSE